MKIKLTLLILLVSAGVRAQAPERVLHSWLTLAGVTNELIIVPNAPHYGEMFDAAYIRERVFGVLKENMK